MPAPSLPYQPPAWLTSRRVAIAAAAMGVAVIGWGVLVGWIAAMASEGSVLAVVLVPAVVGGFLLAPLAVVARLRRDRPSHDAAIRSLRDAGLWLAATSGVAWVLPEVRPVAFIFGIVMGMAASVVALGWLALRWRFVVRLRAAVRLRRQQDAPPSPPPPGPAPSTFDATQPYLDQGVLPYLLGAEDAAYELLIWTPPPAVAAVYRDTTQPVAMALVPIPQRVSLSRSRF